MWLGELLFPASAVLFVFIISHPVGLFVSVWFKLPVCPFQDEGIKPGGGWNQDSHSPLRKIWSSMSLVIGNLVLFPAA